MSLFGSEVLIWQGSANFFFPTAQPQVGVSNPPLPPGYVIGLFFPSVRIFGCDCLLCFLNARHFVYH